MSAVILCEFPSGNADARAWILGRVAVLTVEGKAALDFVGTEDATGRKAATETIAIKIASAARAGAILSEWRQDGLFSGLVETRLLRTENVNFAVAMFP
jgi:hypothetical protein